MNTAPTPNQTTPPTHTNTPKRHRVKIVREFIPLDTPAKPAKSSHPASFQKFSNGVSKKAGSPYALVVALVLIAGWAASGPIFHFSDTWQLVINTTTTIVTFLMVFAIQNTQNRDSRAMQLKLDELINSNRTARSEFVDIEELSDLELDNLHTEFKELHEKFQEARDTKEAK